MKLKHSFVITAFLLTTTAAVLQFLPGNDKLEALQNKHEIEEQGIKGALEYLNKRRMNPQTGSVEISDVMRARKKADIMEAAKSGSSVMQWEFLGPNNVGGRTRAILIDRNNTNHMLAGSVSGGLWVSNDAGLNWQEHPMNQERPCLSVSCLIQAPNGDIYMGTGEKITGWSNDFYGTGNSAFPGCGIYKSTDGGNTFALLENTEPTPNNNTQQWAYIIAMAVHPTNSNLIYAATDRSLYLSTDGGQNWSSPEGIPASSGTAYDVVAATNGHIHVLTGGHYYRSTDGLSFVQKSGADLGNFPVVSDNKKLAVSPTSPNFIYAITIYSSGCLRQVLQSTDGGDTWSEIGAGAGGIFDPLSGGGYCQGWYDLCIAVDPANPQRIFVGGITLWSWSAEDNWLPLSGGGEDLSNPYYVHVDQHAIVFHPYNPDIVFVGNDGGIFRSVNAGNVAPTWIAMNRNYNVTQFYAIAAGFDGRVIGGTQDNGTIQTRFNTESYFAGIDVSGGDGAYTDISKINPDIMFAANQNGRLRRSPNGGESFGYSGFLDQNIDCQPTNAAGDCNPDGEVDFGPEFITPTILWEDVYNNLAVYVTGNGAGQVWLTLEALDVSKVPEWFKIGQFPSGGTVSTVNVARDANGRVMVLAGADNGRVMILRNVLLNEFSGSPSVSSESAVNKKVFSVADITGSSNSRYVTSVSVDASNPQNMVVTMGNYGFTNYVFRSTNVLSNSPVFTSIQGTDDNALPAMPVYDLVIDADNPNRLLAGTDLGVWMCELVQTGATSFDYIWSAQNQNIGRIPVFRIRQEPIGQLGCNVIYIGTHGKGMMRSTSFTFPPPSCNTDLPEWGSAVGVQQTTDADNEIAIYPNPVPAQVQPVAKVTLAKPVSGSTISVYAVTGQLVLVQNIETAVAGIQYIPVNVAQLSKGLYVAVMEVNNQKIACRFLVQ
ncbi:T9SS C-terminal target domain-containing protein [Sphingobacteriales bacterium UPWRP_1]|nr:hypothetical protein BVG80_13155 [Sphingobacteriales bacterium TSM_CSM]PSJ77778.1 T9SS C-terminal target domain-containing protein [Sphingobacteriales bacterium UPWRP_1]